MAKTIIEALLITLGLDDTAHKKGTESVTQDQAKIRREAQQTAKQLKQNGQEASEFFDGMIEKAVGFFAVIAGVWVKRRELHPLFGSQAGFFLEFTACRLQRILPGINAAGR